MNNQTGTGGSRIDKIRAMLETQPADSFLQHALALEFIKLGNEEEARRLFEEILNREAGYIGSYYQLAKVLERTQQTEAAIQVYEKGKKKKKKAGDQHALSELRSAWEELTF